MRDCTTRPEARRTTAAQAPREGAQLRRRQEELQREHGFLRTVIDAVPTMVMVRDADGCCLLANAAAATFHGMTVETLEGRDCHGIATIPHDWLRADREVLQAGKESRGEVEADDADGRRHFLIVSRTPLVGRRGARDLVLATAIDITWRRRAEEAVRDSEAEYRLLAENSPEVIARFDRELRHTYINDYGAKVYGVRKEDIVGRTNADLGMPAEKVAFWARHFETVFASGEQRTVEFEFDSPTFGHQFFSSLFVPERDERGNVRSILAITRDATEARSSQKALAESERRLRQVNEQLAEADRRKDEFIAVLSHELRNPLAPIRYALPVLHRERLTAAGDRAVGVVERQLDHLTRLVDDLLDVSRITRGKIELRREFVTLGSIVNAAVEAASPVIAAARHTLELAVADDPIWLYVDAARIAQVVTNLLNNSVKYTPRGGRIHLEVGLETTASPISERDERRRAALAGGTRAEASYAFIRVTDNGTGIAPDVLPTIFEMFIQAGRSERSQGGLGIGLALVKRLIELHGGTVEARSAGVGQGAEFVVRLPIAREPRSQDVDVPGAGAGTAARRPLKVLVVDDNADLVDMLATLVSALGHDVRKALDGRSALSAVVSYKPDVVLLDLGLPIIGGIEVAREIKRSPDTSRAKLVALTGWGQSENRRQTEEAGFDYHLTKPTDPKTLESLLARFATDITE